MTGQNNLWGSSRTDVLAHLANEILTDRAGVGPKPPLERELARLLDPGMTLEALLAPVPTGPEGRADGGR